MLNSWLYLKIGRIIRDAGINSGSEGRGKSWSKSKRVSCPTGKKQSADRKIFLLRSSCWVSCQYQFLGLLRTWVKPSSRQIERYSSLRWFLGNTSDLSVTPNFSCEMR